MKDKFLRVIYKLGDIGFFTVVLMIFTISVILLCGSIMGTANIALDEVISFKSDNVFLNLLFLLICCAGGALFVIYAKKKKWCTYFDEKQLSFIVWGATIILGVIWITQSLSAPTNDSRITTHAGIDIANGNLAPLDKVYFKRFPFQLGYVLWSEIWARILFIGESDGALALQFINVICLAFANCALVRICQRIFKNSDVTFATAIMLVLFIQPIIFSSFLYGTLPGFCFAVWAIYNLTVYIQDEKIKNLIISAILVSVAIWLKLNNAIFAVAMILVLALHLCRGRYLKNIACIAVLSAVVLVAKNIPIIQYEIRYDAEFGDGIPMVCWLSMGLGESVFAPGWYNSEHTVDIFDGPEDAEKASETAKENIKARLEYFSENPSEAYTFFKEKIYSQWNETTFSSIWNNNVRGQYDPKYGVAKFVCGDGEELVKKTMDINVQFIYFGLTACFVCIFRDKIKKRCFGDEIVLIPTVIIGGFLYHLLFEAKSQYVLTYVIIMIPYAVWGLYRITSYVKNRINVK